MKTHRLMKLLGEERSKQKAAKNISRPLSYIISFNN
jgi:hypothetical protein